MNPKTPLSHFSDCHAGITAALHALKELPALLEPAERARRIAQGTLNLYRNVVHEHHAQEETELFPAVMRSSRPGEEHDRVESMVRRMTYEHRSIEAAFKRLEPALKAIAAGRSATLNTDEIADLVAAYLDHAEYEERSFLPLSATVLSRNRNHMDALDLSLHVRQLPPVVSHA